MNETEDAFGMHLTDVPRRKRQVQKHSTLHFANEAALSAAIVKKLNANEQTICQKVKGSAWGQRTLDIMGSHYGLFFWLEVKQPGNKPTENQFLTMQKWIDHGGHASWTTTVQGAVSFLECIISRKATKEIMLKGF